MLRCVDAIQLVGPVERDEEDLRGGEGEEGVACGEGGKWGEEVGGRRGGGDGGGHGLADSMEKSGTVRWSVT